MKADEVLDFWFRRDSEPGYGGFREEWFRKDPEFDREVRARFEGLHEQAAAGDLDGWRQDARGCLALVILLDQFPRNMFRGDPIALDSSLDGIRFVVRPTVERRTIEEG